MEFDKMLSSVDSKVEFDKMLFSVDSKVEFVKMLSSVDSKVDFDKMLSSVDRLSSVNPTYRMGVMLHSIQYKPGLKYTLLSVSRKLITLATTKGVVDMLACM